MNTDDSNTQPDQNASDSSAQVLTDLEALIKTHIATIDKAKADLKRQREMITSALENDETYRLHNEEAKKAAKTRSQTRFQILEKPENKVLVERAHELSSSIKEQDGALSDYLREYQRMSGTNEIETDDGQVREIVYVAKLIKKPSKK